MFPDTFAHSLLLLLFAIFHLTALCRHGIRTGLIRRPAGTDVHGGLLPALRRYPFVSTDRSQRPRRLPTILLPQCPTVRPMGVGQHNDFGKERRYFPLVHDGRPRLQTLRPWPTFSSMPKRKYLSTTQVPHSTIQTTERSGSTPPFNSLHLFLSTF